jgi:ribA/ribD-fused uncharacterized protein
METIYLMPVVKVERFKGEYAWLSNMTRLETPYETKHGLLPTGEHMYQYAKSTDTEWRKHVVATNNPYQVRKDSRDPDKCKLREDWDEIKDDVMLEVVCYKFSSYNSELLLKLIDLKGIELLEGNYHNDVYWGFCLKTNTGDNRLGKMIMARRDEYIDEGIEK